MNETEAPNAPAPYRQQGRSLRVIVIAVAIAVVAALGGALFAVNVHVNHQTAQLEHQVTVLRHQLSQDQQTITSDDQAVSSMSTQLSKLNVPSDPLAAYNAICHIYANSVLGNQLDWYLPCTFNAQTIPQPSGG